MSLLSATKPETSTFLNRLSKFDTILPSFSIGTGVDQATRKTLYCLCQPVLRIRTLQSEPSIHLLVGGCLPLELLD